MTTPARLRLRRGLMVVPGRDSLQVRSLRRLLMLRGSAATTLLPQVLQYLDGTRTAAEVAAAVGQPEEVEAVISLLERASLLEDPSKAEPGLPERLTALLDSLGSDPHDVAARLQASKVGVLASPGLASHVTHSLAEFGISQVSLMADPITHLPLDLEANGAIANDLRAMMEDTAVVLVALDRWQPPILELINQVCLAARRPWLPVQPINEVTFSIGPFVIPGETACYACQQQRRRANLLESAEMEAALDQLIERVPDAASYLERSVSPLYEPALVMAATEVFKYLAGLAFYMASVNRVVNVSPLMLETESMPVLKIPRCPACSRAAHQPSSRVWMRG